MPIAVQLFSVEEEIHMVVKGRKLIAVLIGLFMLANLGVPLAGSQPDGDADGDRGMGPLSTDPWFDPLDDLSHVYVPGSGLQGIEISGGTAHLKAGFDDGWIASEIISGPAGQRYDLVLLEVDTPGASSFEVSVLNASADPTEIGFANETVTGFKLRTEADLSVYSLSPTMYPDIRIQVNLHAVGTDRPSLLSWSLYFIGLDEWRDDFRGPGKMSDNNNLNFTGDQLEINLSSGMTGGSGPGKYDKLPTITSPAWATVSVFYANAGQTTYQDRDTLTGGQAWGVEMAHLDDDGYMDLIYAERGGTSKIFWGAATGFTNGNSFSLTTPTAQKVAAGDFDGDGWYDLAFANGAGASSVFLNNGDGTFDATADFTWASTNYAEVNAGDVNGDGYDDVIFGTTSTSQVYYGSDTGPGSTRDVQLSGGVPVAVDVDRDGIYDIITRSGTNVYVYLGDSPDIDNGVDYTLNPATAIYSVDAGDINGDGDVDIVVLAGANPNYKTHIYEGRDGWSSSRVHSGTPGGWGRLACADLDKDGYDDIVLNKWISGSTYKMEIYMGGSAWPTTPWLTKDTAYAYDLAFAIPKSGGGGSNRAYRATFTTEEIDLPVDQKWDVAYLEGAFPQNTSMTMSVIDGSSDEVIAGFDGLTQMDADLSKIDGNVFRTIKIQVSIASDLNTTTPVLDALTVKWMDKMVWRDEFFGAAKVDRMHNLDVASGQLRKGTIGGDLPQLIFPAIRGNDNYTTVPRAYSDAGGLDYLSMAPYEFITRGTAAVDTADINGDGFMDVVYAVKQTGVDTFSTASPVFLGGPLGMNVLPDHTFATHGATDVILEDLNDDGYYDVVFAQEQVTAGVYQINSTLFMGSADGWSDEPDFEFVTKGASGVVAVDLNDDGLLDLVFSCYRDVGTSTDSMVFLQEATGWNGSSPDFRLPTKGARAVAAGDINDDDLVDLVFANSLSGGFAEVDSYIYWGKAGGGFDAIPQGLPTSGAEDVKVTDLDGDNDLDIVFANFWDNSLRHEVDSFVYLNGGGGGFSSSPDVRLPTEGATAVAVADLDGMGWLDLVFACQENDGDYNASSRVYLGGAAGWASTPDIEIPTEGASDVLVTKLFKYGTGGYMSVPIRPLEPRETGTFHTLLYTANLGASQSGSLQLVDAITLEVLAETPLASGSNQWAIANLFHIKAHESIRVVAILDGLGNAQPFALDDLWINWTQRMELPPVVHGLDISEPSVLRLRSVELSVDVTDDYDLTEELTVLVQHRINGSDTWDNFLVDSLSYDPNTGTWRTTITPRVDIAVGVYDFRVDATDLDSQFSGWVEFPGMLEVLNNVPTSPVVHILPLTPVTSTQLRVEMTSSASDMETTGLQYVYRWYRDGEQVTNITGDLVPSFYTAKGQNWSVEVSAWDGDDEGLPGVAWMVIRNAPPSTNIDLPDPAFDEDTTDSDWLDLSVAFKDDDGDTITWALASESENLTVTIDHDTGVVTLTPKPDWNGDVELVFVASDGEDTFSQKVTVTINPVNDPPTIPYVDGVPPATDPLVYTIKQGETLVISYDVEDLEGDEVITSVNTTAVTHDEVAGTITFQPGNDAVGTLRFGLRIWDVVSPSEKVAINFVIEIENENDPMDQPSITSPWTGEKFDVNQSFGLVALCDDPDIPWGQVLEYVWTSNISGELGRGSSITVQILEPGTHNITVTVSDPDFSKSASIVLMKTPSTIPRPPTG